jgi:membrane protease YdiL (CAAX protease family)
MTQTENSSRNDSEACSPWGSWLSWLVIICVTFGLLALSMNDPSESENNLNPPRITSMELSQLELQGKTLIFQHRIQPGQEPPPVSGAQVDQVANRASRVPDQMDEGTINQRWCYAVLLNELESPSQAVEHLALTNERLASAQLQLDEAQQQVNQLLQKSFEECKTGLFRQSNLKTDDIVLLREQLGWFADLLIASDKTHPELQRSIANQASKTFAFGFVGFLVGGLAVASGMLLIILMVPLLYFRKLKPGFTPQPSRHVLYLQTFAIWLLIFVGGQVLFELFLSGLDLSGAANRLAWGLIPFVGSLVALAWPWSRGVECKELFSDIGWKMRNPLIEIGSGIAGYLMLLPFMLLALLVFIGLTMLSDQRSANDFSTAKGPSHPIGEYVAEGDSATIVLVILMACVAAPIVEETMFRGVFYRYLRDSNFQRAPWLSIALACLVNSLIFAAIHPQGLLAVPLLGTLAVGFSLAREQRESLIAPMVMHGINNGIVSLLLFFIL